jgi:hypothetical protein
VSQEAITMACEEEKKKVEALAQKLKDFREMQSNTGLSKFALQAAWAWKYGTEDVGIIKIRSDLEAAEADLAACMLGEGAGSIFGSWAKDAVKSLYSLSDKL